MKKSTKVTTVFLLVLLSSVLYSKYVNKNNKNKDYVCTLTISSFLSEYPGNKRYNERYYKALCKAIEMNNQKYCESEGIRLSGGIDTIYEGERAVDACKMDYAAETVNPDLCLSYIDKYESSAIGCIFDIVLKTKDNNYCSKLIPLPGLLDEKTRLMENCLSLPEHNPKIIEPIKIIY